MELQEHLIKLNPMPMPKANLIASYFEKEVIGNGVFLIKEGKTSKKSYFLESGIVRSYIYDRNGDEITTRFYSSPDFLNDYLSFFKQKPSEENYETQTACTVWTINHENVQYCFHNIPEFREWGRMLLTLNYVDIYNRMLSFHKYTAKERYLELLKNKPEIVSQIPLKYIATYLGVTKHSLSRIRKEITLSDSSM